MLNFILNPLTKIEIFQFPYSFWNKRLTNTEFGVYCQTAKFVKYIEFRLKFQPKFLKFFTDSKNKQLYEYFGFDFKCENELKK
jgi:hypothetical protein